MSVNVMQSPVGFRVSSSNHSNGNNQNTDHDHNEFIRSFHLNMLTSSSPILVRNGIEKLGDDCHGARMVRRYFENSNPHKVNIHIKQIWKVHNVGHYAQFMQNGYDEVDNMLLWHGTSRKNLISILQNSLKLPVQATHGHMFGPGIYFADRMSKSAKYTDQSGPEVFLLCQVALGRKYRVYAARKYSQAPGNFNTIKAVGKYVPDIGGQKMLGQSCKIPCGKTVMHREASVRASVLWFNEYIVFDQPRIRIKFIVHCERGGSYLAPAAGSSVALQRPISLRPVGLRPVNLKPVNLRPVNLRPITIGQSNAISSSSTNTFSSTRLMYRSRFNVPSSRPLAATTNDIDWTKLMYLACIAWSYCSKFISSGYFVFLLLFLIGILVSYFSK